MENRSEGTPQTPGPDEGDARRSEPDPRHPTATAPDSVEESVFEQAEYAGKEGPDAADPPRAAGKHESDGDGTAPGADLEPDESADVMETREEAHEIKRTREDQQDESLISLDPAD